MALEFLDIPLLLVIGGIVLMILEAMAPGANFIVLGVALFFAGLLGMFVGPLGTPIALAAMVLLFGAAAFLVYREVDFYGSEAGRTKDSDSLRGQHGRVTETVTSTGGQIKLENGGFNPYYQARSMDGTIEEGEEVIVVDPGGGNVVTVDSVEALGTDDIDRALERDRQQKEHSETPGDSDRTGEDDGSTPTEEEPTKSEPDRTDSDSATDLDLEKEGPS